MHRYYRYLNALFSMTLLLKGGKQVNVLMDSQTLLFFMQPNKTQCINVFDLIQQDIIYVLFYPSKGCIHAPLIMKTIEVVSQTYFEKETHLSPYTLYQIVPANLSRRLKGAPAKAARHDYSSDEPTPMPPLSICIPLVLLLHRVLWATVGEREVGVEVWDLGWHVVLRPYSLCVATFRPMCMSWLGTNGRLMKIYVFSSLLLVCRYHLALRMCLSIHPSPTLISGISITLVSLI